MNDTNLPLSDISAGRSGGGCSCCRTAAATLTTPAREDTTMSTSTYRVEGMTCGHCVSAVTSELSAIEGVNDVTVDLTAGGTSTVTVTSDAPLTEEQVAAALDEAGDYRLAPTN